MSVLAYVLGFLAAVANAGANVVQRAANRNEDAGLQFSLRMIRRLLSKPIWLAGIVAIAGSFFLQAAALGFGTLAAVEPLLVLELPMTLIAARFFLGANLGGREWRNIAVMSASTVALIAFLGPHGGHGSYIAWWVWSVAIAVTIGVVAAQPGVTLADPYVSIIWGAVVFQESFRSGFWIILAVLSGAAMTVAAVRLAGASALSGPQAADEDATGSDDKPYPDADDQPAVDAETTRTDS